MIALIIIGVLVAVGIVIGLIEHSHLSVATPAPTPPVVPVPPVSPVPPVTPTPPVVVPTPTPTPAPVPNELVIAWINESQNNGALTLSDADAASIVAALNLQVPDLKAAWPTLPVITNVVATVNTVPSGALKAYFLANADVAGALGYHDVDPQGDPYIRVFTETVLSNGGSALSGSVSISVCASHEMCEAAVDPKCTATATSPTGHSWALETADPVESNFYTVTTPLGIVVAVSDFVYPAFFQNSPGPYDKLGILKAPFSIAPGGYAIIDNQQSFGMLYPEWRQTTKAFPAARTYRRLHQG